MESNEAGGRSENEFITINSPVESFDASAIFHIVTGVLGFALYMHQQIPSILDDIFLEFEMLRMEHHELELILMQREAKPSSRRVHAGKMREVKSCIRRLEKLMKTVSNVHTALQSMISVIPNVQRVLLVIGSSPTRPQHIYEICFSHGGIPIGHVHDFTKSRIDEGLSRKAIRALISKGAGSETCGGPSKLFLLVQAPSSFYSPLHFLPKRDFKYNKKIVPFRLRFRSRNQHHDSAIANSMRLADSDSSDLIWFQCRHTIKGLPSKNSTSEE